MSVSHPIEELEKLVEISLGMTGVKPQSMPIRSLIPDVILDEYDPLGVLNLAYTYGFIIEECRTCIHPKFRANGKWVEAGQELAQRIRSRNNTYHSTCDFCYVQNLHMRDDRF
jgi:hypothetical protein